MKSPNEGLITERNGLCPRGIYGIGDKMEKLISKRNVWKENGGNSGKKERFVTKRKGWSQTETFNVKKEGLVAKMNVEIKFSIEVTKIMSSQ